MVTTTIITRTVTTTPRVILGTMTFGGTSTTYEDATTMVLDFCTNSKWNELVTEENPQLDSAIMYQNGKTEIVLGKMLSSQSSSLLANATSGSTGGTSTMMIPNTVSIASKANAFTKGKDFSPSGIRNQLESSLKSFNIGTTNKDNSNDNSNSNSSNINIDIYYLHAPDTNHNIEPTLDEIQKLYHENKFHTFGISNFTAWETVYIYNYMKERNYILPTIYQGMYNAITRQVETELFPSLRKCNIQFYAYNPLAGGMLSGKYISPSKWLSDNDNTNDNTNDSHDSNSSDKELAKLNSTKGDRFAGNSSWAKKYRERFQQKEQFDALEIVRHQLKLVVADSNQNNNDENDDTITTNDTTNDTTNTTISMAEASLRWIRHHSQLTEKDGIIVGASKLSHYHSNMNSLSNGPLPAEIVKAFDDAYVLCKDVCPSYSRGYSGSSIVAKSVEKSVK